MDSKTISGFLINKIGPTEAYAMGVDCGLHGANLVNCNFKIFSSPENTKAWERGKAEAEQTKNPAIMDKTEPAYDTRTKMVSLRG